MTGSFRAKLPPRRPSRWNTLPAEEKKRQFRDLLHSSYWYFLPPEIQDRIRELMREEGLPEENGERPGRHPGTGGRPGGGRIRHSAA